MGEENLAQVGLTAVSLLALILSLVNLTSREGTAGPVWRSGQGTSIVPAPRTVLPTTMLSRPRYTCRMLLFRSLHRRRVRLDEATWEAA